MFESIAPAFFGLLGTLVGGLLTYRQQTLQGRQTQRHEAESRAVEIGEGWRKTRLQAAVEFINRADRLVDSTREYWTALDARVTSTELQRAKDAYLTDWRRLVADFASFQLTVTPDLNEAGSSLRNAVKDYTVAVDAVAGADNAAARAKAARAAEQGHDTIWELRREFIGVAQRELGNPGRVLSQTVPASA
jgi:hypothetical protein